MPFQGSKELKRRITSMVIRSRRERLLSQHPDVPRFISEDWVLQPDGTRLRRLKMILMSNGCSVPTCTMCPFTNENNFGRRDQHEQVIVDQVREALHHVGTDHYYDCIAIYNDGSFFAPREIPYHTALAVAKLVSAHKFSLLTVESLPQFINESRLLSVLDALGVVQLEVGLGLQSSNPDVRELCVNTSFDNKTFEKSVKLLQRYGIRAKIYIMLKPPFLTEAEAVGDALNSIEYCRSLGVPYVTLCPTRVAPNTLAWDLMQADTYAPPNLWTIVDTARSVSPEVTLRVACINLRDEDFTSAFSKSCSRCEGRVLAAIEAFSEGALDALELRRCDCVPKPIEPHAIPTTQDLQTRIQKILDIVVDSHHPTNSVYKADGTI